MSVEDRLGFLEGRVGGLELAIDDLLRRVRALEEDDEGEKTLGDYM